MAALAEVVAAPAWSAVLTAYARCKRIVRNLPERYPLTASDDLEPATQELLAAWQSIDATKDVAVVAEALRALVAPINTFFDKVLVNDPDPEVKAARLGLLASVRELAPAGLDYAAVDAEL